MYLFPLRLTLLKLSVCSPHTIPSTLRKVAQVLHPSTVQETCPPQGPSTLKTPMQRCPCRLQGLIYAAGLDRCLGARFEWHWPNGFCFFGHVRYIGKVNQRCIYIYIFFDKSTIDIMGKLRKTTLCKQRNAMGWSPWSGSKALHHCMPQSQPLCPTLNEAKTPLECLFSYFLCPPQTSDIATDILVDHEVMPWTGVAICIYVFAEKELSSILRISAPMGV